MAMVWAEEAKTWALALAKDGHSAGAIARMINQRFDTNKTRNAVIGMCYRNGACLTGHASKRERQQRSKAWQARQVKAIQPKALPKPKTALQKIFAVSEPLPPPQDTDIGTVRIDDLTSLSCRWPCGEPSADMLYCGNSKVTGLPYCEPHVRRAFQPPQVNTYAHTPTPSLTNIEKLEEIQTA